MAQGTETVCVCWGGRESQLGQRLPTCWLTRQAQGFHPAPSAASNVTAKSQKRHQDRHCSEQARTSLLSQALPEGPSQRPHCLASWLTIVSTTAITVLENCFSGIQGQQTLKPEKPWGQKASLRGTPRKVAPSLQSTRARTDQAAPTPTPALPYDTATCHVGHGSEFAGEGLHFVQDTAAHGHHPPFILTVSWHCPSRPQFLETIGRMGTISQEGTQRQPPVCPSAFPQVLWRR